MHVCVHTYIQCVETSVLCSMELHIGSTHTESLSPEISVLVVGLSCVVALAGSHNHHCWTGGRVSRSAAQCHYG